MTHDIIGVDIAKDWIDIHTLSTGQGKRLATSRSALARFAAQVGGVLVVMEASGGYERPLMEALAEAGVPFARVNPRLRAFRNRLGAAGKPTKVAIVAVARKLLTILNAMFRDENDYRSA